MIKKMSKSFTLIELLVVITIIAILAGLVLPQLGKAQDSANRTTSTNNIKSLCTAVIAETGLSRGSYYSGLWMSRLYTLSEDMWVSGLAGASYTTVDTATNEVIPPQDTSFKVLVDRINAAANGTGAYTITAFDDPNANMFGTADTAAKKSAAIAAAALVAQDNATSALKLSGLSTLPDLDKERSQFNVFGTYNNQHPFLGFYVFQGGTLQTGALAGAGVYRGTRGVKKLDPEARIVGELYPLDEGDSLGGIGFADGHVSLIKLGEQGTVNGVPSVHFATITGNVLNQQGEVSVTEHKP